MNIYYILKVSENSSAYWNVDIFELKTQQVCSLIMVSLAVVSANQQRINTKK